MSKFYFDILTLIFLKDNLVTIAWSDNCMLHCEFTNSRELVITMHLKWLLVKYFLLTWASVIKSFFFMMKIHLLFA